MVTEMSNAAQATMSILVEPPINIYIYSIT